jgi:tRNA(adenine34) deaminase
MILQINVNSPNPFYSYYVSGCSTNSKIINLPLASYPIFTHEYFMNKALQLASTAFDEGEVPVGAIIVAEGGRIIGKGYNQTEKLNDVTAHAEILAISAASQYLGAKYLRDCTLYVTLEPCVMCAGALAWSQIDRIIFGAPDDKRGFSGISQRITHPKTEIISGILAEECQTIMRDFFKNLR